MYYNERSLVEELAQQVGSYFVKLSHTGKKDVDSVSYFYLNSQVKEEYAQGGMYFEVMQLITHGGYFAFEDKVEAEWFCELFNRFLTVNSKYKVERFY